MKDDVSDIYMCIPVPMEGNKNVSSVREQKGEERWEERGGGRGGGGGGADRETDRVCHTCSVHTVITWCIVVWCAQNVRLDGSHFTQHHAAM